MNDRHQSGHEQVNLREAENLLRKAAFAADPFIALSESYRRVAREERLTPFLMEDEEGK